MVEVQAGSYPAQNIVDSSPLKSCSAASFVVFRPRAGASVTVQKLNFGQWDVGNGGDWVEVRDMAVATRVELFHGSSHIRIIRVNGGSFSIQGSHDLYFEGNDWGPCASSGEPSCTGQNFIDANYGSSLGTYNIEINRDTFHDFTITPGSGDHFECLFTTGANGNVTIRNSRFYNCETYGIFFQGRLPNHGFDAANYLIENNWFGRTCCFGSSDRNSAVTFASVLQPKNVLIRYNTFAPGQGVVTEGGATPSNVRVVANIIGDPQCVPGIQYARNLFLRGRCSPDDRTSVYGYRFDGTRLVVDKPRSTAIQAAFRDVAGGLTLARTARQLASSRLAPAPGRWTATTLRGLLTDDVYLGHRLGRQSQHAPLVSLARWKAVQKALRQK